MHYFKIRKIKITALIIIIIVITNTLFSCEIITINKNQREDTTIENETQTFIPDDTTNTQTTLETEVTTKKIQSNKRDNKTISGKYLNALPTRNFKNIGVTIATSDVSTFIPVDLSDPVNVERIERNKLVEQKYNTHIMLKQTDASTMYKEVNEAHLSGMYHSELLSIPMSWLGLYQSSGLLLNLRSLPFTNFSAPYYNHAGMEQVSAGNNIYASIGELNNNLDYLYAMFFNKDLILKYKLENPYDLVYKGEWTWEKFRQMTIAVSNDINGHGAVQTGNLYYDIMFSSIDEKYISTGLNKIPQVTYFNDRSKKIIDIMKDILFNDKTMFVDNSKDNTNIALNKFCAGNLLFYTDRLYISPWLSNIEINWGILPFPKLDKSQPKYNTFCDMSMPVLSVLTTNNNVENTGLLLQAMNAASYGYINDAYMTNLMNYVIRDNDSLNMLEYISNNRSFDFAMMFGSGDERISAGTFYSMRATIKTNASLESIYKMHIDTLQPLLDNNFAMQK